MMRALSAGPLAAPSLAPDAAVRTSTRRAQSPCLPPPLTLRASAFSSSRGGRGPPGVMPAHRGARRAAAAARAARVAVVEGDVSTTGKP